LVQLSRSAGFFIPHNGQLATEKNVAGAVSGYYPYGYRHWVQS